jgi:hypothetical protein
MERIAEALNVSTATVGSDLDEFPPAGKSTRRGRPRKATANGLQTNASVRAVTKRPPASPVSPKSPANGVLPGIGRHGRLWP